MMNRRKHPWVLFMELLCRFSGEDYQLIAAAGTGQDLLIRFASIGGLVLAIFILSFYSSTHFVSHLLSGNHFAAMPIGVIWALMIMVIYLLLLFTITPAMLIGRDRSIRGQARPITTEKKRLAQLSLMVRIAFVILIAMVVAQPWLVTLFNTNAELDRYRQKYRSEFIIQADSSLIGMEADAVTQLHLYAAMQTHPDQAKILMLDKKVQADLRFLSDALRTEQELLRKTQNKNYRPDTLEDRLADMVKEEEVSDSLFQVQYALFPAGKSVIGQPDAGEAVMGLIRRKMAGRRRLDALLSASNFYTRKVQLVNSSHPMAWVVTSLVVFVFVMPIALKYRIRNRTDFYGKKKLLEEEMVKSEYEQFKGAYSQIFKNKFGIHIRFYESCTDPPFNTKKIREEVTYAGEKSLLVVIYPDSEESERNKYLVSEKIS